MLNRVRRWERAAGRAGEKKLCCKYMRVSCVIWLHSSDGPKMRCIMRILSDSALPSSDDLGVLQALIRLLSEGL